MNGIVIDASVALSWLLRDESNDFADRVLDALSSAVAFAPPIWAREIANGLLAAERRRRLPRDPRSTLWRASLDC